MTGRIWEWDGIQGNKDFATHVEEIHEFVRRNEHLPKLKSENSEDPVMNGGSSTRSLV